MMLNISNLFVRIKNKEILSNINLSLTAGDVLLITGHNGSGKSTLLHAIMGRPDIVTEGSINFYNNKVLELECHERARLGIFMFHQSPPTIEGVNTMTLFNEINNLQQEKINKRTLIDLVRQNFKGLNLPDDWTKRQFNAGASGGERKKNELALAEFFPNRLLLLDEPDSGLEQNSRDRIKELIAKNQKQGGISLLVTHDESLQDFYKDNKIELKNGRIV